jgi:Rieske Fe-S protein
MEDVNAGSDNQTRREFCNHVFQAGGLLLMGTSFGQFLVGCKEDSAANAPQLPTVSGSLAGGTVVVNNVSGTALAATGSASLVQYSGSPLLVAHSAQDTFVAVTSICTHQQCTITGFKDQLYVCPCHGSQFHTNGQVAQGPANAPLRTLATQFANDQLTIML